jgi:hypothetical protein
MNHEPAATVVYVRSSDFSNKVVRKDFATEAAALAWMDKNEDKVDVVEVRWYTDAR